MQIYKLKIQTLYPLIEGIGHISTRWVGQRGKEELLTEVKANKYRIELEELKAQATHLASECKKALLLVNHPETSKAIDLCNNFLMPTGRQKKEKINESLRSLWKGQYLPKISCSLYAQWLRILYNTTV